MALQRDNNSLPLEQRVPPQNVELEMAVLGGVMLEPQEAYPLVADILTRDSWYLDGHGILFEVMGGLFHRGIPPDAQSVLDELRARDLLQRVGGSGVVMGMLNAVPTAANVEYHARKIKDKADLRAMIRGCTKVIEECYRQELDKHRIFDIAGETVNAIVNQGHRAEVQGVCVSLQDYWETISDRDEERTRLIEQGIDISNWIPGVKTGLPGLDRMTKGAMPARLWTVLARTSTGKTTMMLTWAHEMAVEQNEPVGFISLEMPLPSLNNRLLACGSRHTIGGKVKFIDSMRIEQVGRPLDAAEWSIATRSYQRLSAAPLYPVAPAPHWDGEGGVRAHIGAMARAGCKVVFVDYIQRFDSTGDDDWLAIGKNASRLKTEANRWGITVITASQVNDAIYGTNNKRNGWIGLQNTSRSKIINNESDVVVAIEPLAFDKARLELGEYVLPKRPLPTETGLWPDRPAHDEHFMLPGLLNVLKNRDGPTGFLPIGFFPHGQRFVERSYFDEPARAINIQRQGRDGGD